jgi:aminodeoxyfutalosine synthase
MLSFQPEQNSSARTSPLLLNTLSILDAVEDGRTLSVAEAIFLLEITKEEEISRLKQLAETLNQRDAGDSVYYDTGASLFLTNRCEMAPALYPYPRVSGDQGAYTLTIDEIDAVLELAQSQKLSHVTLSGGGFWPMLCVPGLEAATVLKTHIKLMRHIREKNPELRLQGFSPDEIEFFCILKGRNERYVMELLMDHGLEVLDGFGSEILVDRVRAQISPKKATVKRWLEIVATAHQLKLPVIARMEAGPVETLAQRVRHLAVLRDFQQKHPAAFQCLVPQMWTSTRVQPGRSGVKPALTDYHHRQKLIAVTRLFLSDCIPVQQVIWQPDQVSEAQDALTGGANYVGGCDALTYIQFLAGNCKPKDMKESELASLIMECGKEPRLLACGRLKSGSAF